jgi:hypothetical protein
MYRIAAIMTEINEMVNTRTENAIVPVKTF